MKRTLRGYLKKARNENWAIGQFNFSTLEQLQGIIIAAKAMNAPIIAGTSEGENRYFGLKQAILMVKLARAEDNVPIFLNLDHGKDLSYLRSVIVAGYDAVHIDGSQFSLEENIKLTKEITALAFKKGIIVEGEVGHIGGTSEAHQEKASFSADEYTNCGDAVRFAEETKVDLLAVMVGSVHGIYKKMPPIDHNRLREISGSVKPHLVFHGGSGFSDLEIRRVIREGIVKININTEIRIAWKKAVWDGLNNNKKEYKPYKVLANVSNEVARIVMAKIKLFGSQNKA